MNVRAVIVGGEMDEQFSNETAFQAAGADAVRKAMRDNICSCWSRCCAWK